MAPVFIVNGLSGLGATLVGGSTLPVAVLPTGAGSGGSSTGSSAGITALSPVAPRTTSTVTGQRLLQPTATQMYTSDAARLAALARETEQRLITVTPWLVELERRAADSRQRALLAEPEWAAVHAGTASNPEQFVPWIGKQRRYADSNLQEGLTLEASVRAHAGGDTRFRDAVTRAHELLVELQARAGRIAELERWGVEKAAAAVRPAVGATQAMTADAPKKFPVWGYAVGGVVILGAALYFGGK